MIKELIEVKTMIPVHVTTKTNHEYIGLTQDQSWKDSTQDWFVLEHVCKLTFTQTEQGLKVSLVPMAQKGDYEGSIDIHNTILATVAKLGAKGDLYQAYQQATSVVKLIRPEIVKPH